MTSDTPDTLGCEGETPSRQPAGRRRYWEEPLSTPTTTQPSAGSDWEIHSHQDKELVQVLGLTSATMLVMGSMIGSGIFLVSACLLYTSDAADE